MTDYFVEELENINKNTKHINHKVIIDNFERHTNQGKKLMDINQVIPDNEFDDEEA